MKYIQLIIVSFLLCSCGPSAQEAKDRNKDSLSTPELIGVLEDGRSLYRVTISREGEVKSDRVYYTKEGRVSANYEVTSGKTTIVESIGAIE
jgi:hypothetical protein